MSGGGEKRTAGLALKHGFEVMIRAYLEEEGRSEGPKGRHTNLLSALAIVIRAVSGSVISSKNERMLFGAGFDGIGSRPA
jgi:hypothetical protein